MALPTFNYDLTTYSVDELSELTMRIKALKRKVKTAIKLKQTSVKFDRLNDYTYVITAYDNNIKQFGLDRGYLCNDLTLPMTFISDTRSKYDVEENAVPDEYNRDLEDSTGMLMQYISDEELPHVQDGECQTSNKMECGDYDDPITVFGTCTLMVFHKQLECGYGLVCWCEDSEPKPTVVILSRDGTRLSLYVLASDQICSICTPSHNPRSRVPDAIKKKDCKCYTKLELDNHDAFEAFTAGTELPLHIKHDDEIFHRSEYYDDIDTIYSLRNSCFPLDYTTYSDLDQMEAENYVWELIWEDAEAAFTDLN